MIEPVLDARQRSGFSNLSESIRCGLVDLAILVPQGLVESGHGGLGFRPDFPKDVGGLPTDEANATYPPFPALLIVLCAIPTWALACPCFAPVNHCHLRRLYARRTRVRLASLPQL